MASKKNIKKDVKQMVYDLMDECDYVIVSGDKNAPAASKLMDEVAAFYNDMVPKINAANNNAEFKSIRSEIETKAIEFVEKVNKL